MYSILRLITILVLSSSLNAQIVPIFDRETGLISDRPDHNLSIQKLRTDLQDSTAMWWNIQMNSDSHMQALDISKQSSSEKSLSGKDSSAVFLNLSRLLEASPPSILILGEFDRCLGKKRCRRSEGHEQIKQLVQQAYGESNVRMIPYTPKTSFLIAWDQSRYQLNSIHQEHLDWGQNQPHPRYSKQTIGEYWNRVCQGTRMNRNCTQFDRKFVHLEFFNKISKDVWHVFPVHLLQPWKIMLEYGYSVLEVKYQIQYGSKNPINIQAQKLRKKIKRRLQQAPKGNTLILGDFNSPQALILGGALIAKAWAFRVFDNYFHSLLSPYDLTWPTPFGRSQGLNSFPSLSIDHAFVNRRLRQKFKSAHVPEFGGSDHYPVFLKFKTH